jgi:hypothetical protein
MAEWLRAAVLKAGTGDLLRIWRASRDVNSDALPAMGDLPIMNGGDGCESECGEV